MLTLLAIFTIIAGGEAGGEPESAGIETIDAVAETEVDGAEEETLFETGVEAEGEADSELPLLFDVSLTLGFTAREGEPETGLYQNTDYTWAVEDLLQPRDSHIYGTAALAAGIEYEATSWLLLTALLDSGQLRPGPWLDPPLDQEGLTIDGQTVEEAAKSNAFIRSLSAAFFLGPTMIEIGRRRTSLAHGLVYDDYGTGIFFGLSFEEMGLGPWRLEAMGLLVGDTITAFEQPNPLFALRVSLDFSMFESLSLFGAVFLDQGTLHNVLASAVGERWIVGGPPPEICIAAARAYPVVRILNPTLENIPCRDVALDGLIYADRASSGTLGYVGLSGNYVPVDGLSIRGAFAMSAGRSTVDVELNPYFFRETADEMREEFPQDEYPDLHTEIASLEETLSYRGSFALLGWAASLEVEYGLAQLIDSLAARDLDLELGLFGFAISGSLPPQLDGTYNAFVGVAPYWVWTGIFFSGGLSQSFQAGRTTAAGINGHGVFGGGPSVVFDSDYGFVEVRGAYLGAMVPPPSQRRTYGFELDIIGAVEVVEWARLEAELDLFFAGGFFPQQRLGYRVIAWLNVGYAN